MPCPAAHIEVSEPTVYKRLKESQKNYPYPLDSGLQISVQDHQQHFRLAILLRSSNATPFHLEMSDSDVVNTSISDFIADLLSVAITIFFPYIVTISQSSGSLKLFFFRFRDVNPYSGAMFLF